jgi:toluene monooxygenase system ferredoxin subunit
MAGVRIDGRDILLVNLGSHGVHAYDNRCPHAGTRLSDGRLRLTTLQCSAHHWEFDVRTGGGVNPRNCSLQRFPTKVLDRLILVKLGDRTH